MEKNKYLNRKINYSDSKGVDEIMEEQSVYIKNKKIIIFINIFLSIIILLFFFLRNYKNFDFELLIISMFMLVCLFDFKTEFFAKYFFSIFYCLFMLLGLFLCNNYNIYLYEIAKNSHYNGSFALCIIYYIIFFLHLILFDNIFAKKNNYIFQANNKNLKIKNSNKINIFMLTIGILLFICVLKNPSFKLGVDRFNYKKYYMPNWLTKLQTIYIIATPTLLFSIICKNKNIILKDFVRIFIILIPFILYGIWTGNKFGLFFNIIIFLLSPLSVYINNYKNIKSNIQHKNQSKHIKKILLVSFVILVGLLIPYYIFRGFDFGQSLINRIAQQGQLWWATFEIDQYSSIHIDEINDELVPIKSMFLDYDDEYNYGVYKIMKLTTPYNIYISKLSSGSRYSAQGIEIAFYYFKYIGIILHAILRAFFEALLVNLLIKYVFSCKFIETIIIARFINIFHSIFTQGDLYTLFSKTSIITLIILLFIVFINSTFKRKNLKTRNYNTYLKESNYE